MLLLKFCKSLNLFSASNTRLQEQVDRLQTYSESLEQELKCLQEKTKLQSADLLGGSEVSRFYSLVDS